MAVFSCAVVPLIDVLLCILPGEVDVVVRLPRMWRACLTCMSVWDVETTGITCIPIHIPLCEVRVRRGLDMLRRGWCPIISSAACGLQRHVPCCSSCCDCCEGGSMSLSKTRGAATTSTTTSSSLSAASKSGGGRLSASSESVGGKQGRWLKLSASSRTSDSAAGITLIE